MSFIKEIKIRAKKDIKTIILPEAEDIRVIEAASKIAKQGFAKVVKSLDMCKFSREKLNNS